jgi:hypothetical protein
MQASLLEWRSMPRNSLRGFATVRLGKSLKIKDIPVHCSHGKRWASLPSKPMIGSDGTAQRDERGKIKYVPILEWTNREAQDEFSNAVLEAIEREFPGQTAGDYAGG